MELFFFFFGLVLSFAVLRGKQVMQGWLRRRKWTILFPQGQSKRL